MCGKRTVRAAGGRSPPTGKPLALGGERTTPPSAVPALPKRSESGFTHTPAWPRGQQHCSQRPRRGVSVSGGTNERDVLTDHGERLSTAGNLGNVRSEETQSQKMTVRDPTR